MKEALVHAGPRIELKESPIPTPNASQVVIKVVFSGTNPKDWKYIGWTDKAFNPGDDIAGIVHAVGSDITEFKPGDRVAAFHEMNTPGGSFAEYALAWGHTTFHIPKQTSFEEASTLPLAFMTAALALYNSLHLPLPFVPAPQQSPPQTPLLIYSGASAVGAYAIKLARVSNIHPIIAVAGASIPFVKTLLDPSKGDTVLDYRDSPQTVTSNIKAAVAKTCGAQGKLQHALDAATLKGSWDIVSKSMDGKGSATFILPDYQNQGLPETLDTSMTFVGAVHQDKAAYAATLKQFGSALKDSQRDMGLGTKEFGYVWFRLLGRGLQEGWMTGHPWEGVEGGLETGWERALGDLQGGKASGKKLIIKVGEV
ncbi:hypothetical protein N7G274_008825 [Stereocaulon virgatum]|uniref:Enoyl reductase (ER) domain-containing protein n=1 Tax=Stereocaulon virgatum TaxID=373712 RepID=A0ABR3ZZN5_9LECA